MTMAEVVTVETSKPQIRSVTLKLNATDAKDIMTFISTYYLHYGYGKNYETTHPTYRAIKDALEGVKPKLDGLSVANGKVAFV